MNRLFKTVVSLFILAGAADLRSQDARDFIFAARRSGIAEVIDAATLDTVARVHFDFHVERFRSNADGSKLHVQGYATGAACCKNYTLDPSTWTLEEDVPSTQRTGSYGNCLISPDGRWCFQTKSFRGPALKTVDLQSGTTRELVPSGLPPENNSGNWYAQGAWSGDRFYFYVERPDHPGFLWTVFPGAQSLGLGITVAPFNEDPACHRRLPEIKVLTAAGGNLFLHEPFGNRNKAERYCQGLPGGAWIADPATGNLISQIAPEYHFDALIADPAQAFLYGVATGQLIRLDARDGKVLKSRTMDPGEILAIAVGPLKQIPTGDVTTHLKGPAAEAADALASRYKNRQDTTNNGNRAK